MDKISMSRRGFLGMASLALALPVQALSPPMRRMGVAIGFGKADKTCFIGSIDFDTPQRTVRWQSDIDFLGHGFIPNPVRPHLAVIAEKHGPGCVEWDLSARRVTRAITTATERQFYGHGAFTPDGRTLFLVESIVGDGSFRGVISVRDGSTYETTGEFPSFGMAPHDAWLVDGGRTLVITNGGGPAGSNELPCVCFVDVATRQLRQRLVLPEHLSAGHLAFGDGGRLAVVSAPRNGTPADSPANLGGISLYAPATGLNTPAAEIIGRMRGETLSVAFHVPTGVVAATNPAGDLLTFWDFTSGRLLRATDRFPGARGISLTLDLSHFVLTYGRGQPHAILIDAQTLQPVEESYVERSYISGSHNYIYPLA